MQNQVNQVVIEGNLAADPEIRHFPNRETGEAIAAASLRLANNVIAAGSEVVNFLPVEVAGSAAEFCEKYLRKGDAVIVTGQLRQDRWVDDQSQKRSKLFVKAHKVHGRGRRGEGEREKVAEPESEPAGVGAVDPDDIPF